jgi:hypothetical protein
MQYAMVFMHDKFQFFRSSFLATKVMIVTERVRTRRHVHHSPAWYWGGSALDNNTSPLHIICVCSFSSVRTALQTLRQIGPASLPCCQDGGYYGIIIQSTCPRSLSALQTRGMKNRLLWGCKFAIGLRARRTHVLHHCCCPACHLSIVHLTTLSQFLRFFSLVCFACLGKGAKKTLGEGGRVKEKTHFFFKKQTKCTTRWQFNGIFLAIQYNSRSTDSTFLTLITFKFL